MNVNARDMRYRLRSVLGAVGRGEEVYLTYRGKVMAKMVPVEAAPLPEDGVNPFYGLWKDRAEIADVDGYVRRLRKGRIAHDH